MKKILAFILASAMMLSVASCGSKDNNTSSNTSSENTSSSTPVEEPKEYTGTLTDLVAGIYTDITFEFPIGEPMEIAVSDAEVLPFYLGTADTAAFTEAYFSEAMMGSQAYSLCVARLADASKAEAIAKEVAEKTDMNKWICVGATDLMVLTYGDVLMMVMIDENLGVASIEEFKTAFETVCGGEADFQFENSQER